jgi:proton-dependent oligopeptide transporter, POT family
MSNTATPAANSKHPKGLYLLFFTEMWERFGFYLMLGILFLYMTDGLKGGLGFEDGAANDWYGTYIALVYLTPFIGGLLADRIFGYRKTIIAGGALMAAGYLTLAIPGTTAFFIALLLIIVGNGLFKPNISTLLGNLYNKPEYVKLKDSGYNIFYMGINIGAFVCNFIAAWLRNEYGWGYAFAAAGIGMIIGLITFVSGSKSLADADQMKPAQKEDMPMSRIVATIFLPALAFAAVGFFAGRIFGVENIFGSTSNDIFLFACIPVLWFYLSTYLKSSPEDKKPLGSLMYIYVVVIIFWAIFHQNGNVLTAWAERNTYREMPVAVQGITSTLSLDQVVTVPTDPAETPNDYLANLPADKMPAPGESTVLISTELFQSLNPFFVVLLSLLVVIPLFTWLGKRGKEPTTPAKIALGLFITGLSTLVMIAAVAYSNNGVDKVSAWWLVGTYAVITLGELCLSPMGLSLVSKLSPARLTAVMMGGWFLSTSIGNKLAGVLGHMGSDSTNKSLVFYINCAGAMICAFLLFIAVKRISAVLKAKTGHY